MGFMPICFDMRHVKQIEELLENGQPVEAGTALEDLLELGSQNTSALKLKAHLHGAKGEFDQELEAWKRVHELDPADIEARAALETYIREQQETLFFADELENGDRRFVPFPYGSIRATSTGLVGCCIFLVSLQLMQSYQIKPTLEVIGAGFLLFVLVPWFWILYQFIVSPTSILLSKESIEVKTRFRRHRLNWDEVQNTFLGWDAQSADDAWLCLWVIPRDKAKRGIELNLSPGESVIKPKRYFLQGINSFYRSPTSMHISKIPEWPNPMLKV